MPLFRKHTSVVGVDIGSSYIKAASMAMKGGVYSLESFAFERLSEGAFQSGEVRDPQSLADALLAAVRKCDRHTGEVVIALPNYSILSDVLTMDLLPKKEIHEAVMVEAERLSPFDIKDVEIDFEVLERDEEAKQMKVLMVAAKNDIIRSFVEALNIAGLVTTIIDVDIFSLINIFHLNYQADQYRSCILINLGMDTTDAAFLQNGMYHSSRDIPISGTNFENQLALKTGISKAQVHEVLNGRIEDDIDVERVIGALNGVSKDFANAVGTAVSYFQSSDTVDKVDLIVMAGGFVHVPGLFNILEVRTGAEVIMLDPFRGVTYDPEIFGGKDPAEVGASLAVAMGLATRHS